ncbi:MAG: MOSC domain-containing protein YiiM [Methylophagaceae bacterium]|jgi:MOSC domain-containing protein YiiM
MHLQAINVSKPKLRRFGFKLYTTAFLKKPVIGPVKLSKDNFAGDQQSDLMNHGGNDKAVYAFSTDHYDYWKKKLGLEHIDHGKFGENLSISGLDESDISIGDRIQINDCILEVSQPRIPCYKISFEFKEMKMLNNFIDYANTGVYFRIIQGGTMTANSPVEVIYKHPANITVKNLFRAYFDSKFPDQEQVLRSAITIPELAEAWRSKMVPIVGRIDSYHQRQNK